MSEGKTIEVKHYLFKALRYWYLFLCAMGLAYFVAKVYISYQPKTYKTSGKVLIRDENQKSYMSSIVDELALSSGYKNMHNEIEILKSHKLILRTLQKLPFYVSYYSEGDIKKKSFISRFPLHRYHRFFTLSDFRSEF